MFLLVRAIEFVRGEKFVEVSCTAGYTLFNLALNDIFSFSDDTSLGNYTDDSSKYPYNKNLETVIIDSMV